MIKSLEITVRSSCPLACCWCPQDKLAEAYRSDTKDLAVTDFEKVLDKLPKDCRVDFSGMVEPMLHREIGQMICMAKLRGFQVFLYTTLIGITTGKMGAIQTCGLDLARIHVPDLRGLLIPDDKWIGLHEIWRKGGIASSYMAMGELTPKVAKYLKSYGIEVDMPSMTNRAGNVESVDVGRHIKGMMTCSMERYTQNVLLPNCDVWGCCCVYNGEIRLGNLLTEPYAAIHARALEWSRETNPPDDSPCRRCSWGKPL